MGLRNLAEAIILQSIEDLWNERLREDCLKFLNGEGFTTCASLAGLNLAEKSKLLELIDGSMKTGNASLRRLRKGKDIEYSVSRR